MYTSILSVLTVTAPRAWSLIATRHLVLVLLTTWGVYVYRDVWPLATFTLTPADAAEGWCLWVKVALLTFAAVIVPVVMPAQYTPFDSTVCNVELMLLKNPNMLYRAHLTNPILYKRRRG